MGLVMRGARAGYWEWALGGTSVFLSEGASELLGMEGAGIVAEVGYGVTRLKPGDRVVAGLRVGGFAEEVNVPELACRPIPGSMDFAAAAA